MSPPGSSKVWKRRAHCRNECHHWTRAEHMNLAKKPSNMTGNVCAKIIIPSIVHWWGIPVVFVTIFSQSLLTVIITNIWVRIFFRKRLCASSRTKRFGCHADRQEVSWCRTRGESEISITLRQLNTQKTIQRQIDQWPHKKHWWPPIFLEKSVCGYE